LIELETDYLLVAYKLAILTFYIGVLLYALPIPWPPLKRWAPRLIVDGIFVTSITFLFYGLFEVSDYVARLLGGSWPLFYAWFQTALTNLLDMKAFVFIIGSIVGQLPFGDAVNVLLRPLDRVVDVGLFVIGWIGAITYIIHEFGKALAAIGIALLAVPFRLSRGAGAWFLSFVLVFNAGLQVLPSFLASIAEQPGGPNPSQLESYGLAFANVDVFGYGNSHIGGGILTLKVDDSDLYANYTIIGSRAYDDYFSSNIPVPSRAPSYYTLEIDGVRVNLKPYPVMPEDYETYGSLWQVTLSTDYIMWVGNYTIVYTNGTFIDYTSENETMTVTARLDSSEYVALRYPVNCQVNVTYDESLRTYASQWNWHGIQGVEIRFLADTSGEYTFNIERGDCQSTRPSFGKTMNYFEIISGLGAFTDINLLSSILLYYATIPLVYVFTLFSITFGIARALGGRDRIPIKI